MSPVMSLLAAAIGVLLVAALPSSASALAGTSVAALMPRRHAGRSLLQGLTGTACVTGKCFAQLSGCLTSDKCVPGLTCAQKCLDVKSAEAYVACAAKCVYTWTIDDKPSAVLSACILANKCAQPKFPRTRCPITKKQPFAITALRGKYTVVLGATVADRLPTQYTFAGASITLQVRPPFLKPARTIKTVSKNVGGTKYQATVGGLKLTTAYAILASTADRKFVVLGSCGAESGAVSVVVLSTTGALPPASAVGTLTAGMNAAGWGSRYPYRKLVKVAKF